MVITLDGTYRPLKKWASLYAAGHRMLKEIFLYRARVGSYRAVRSDGSEGNHLHRKNFSLTTTEIWNELISSDMKNGSLLRKSSLLTNDATFKPDHQNNKAKASRGYFAMYPFRSHTLKSTLLKPELEMSRKSQSMKYSSPKVAPSNFGEQHEEKTSIPKKSTKEENYFKSIIRSNEYVDLRLKQKIQEYQNVLPPFDRQLKQLQLFIILVTSLGSFFVAIELHQWVPVLLGLTAGAEWIVSYRQLDGRLPAINHALGELIQLLLWWDGLSILQQRMPYYKEQLVTSTEEIIVKEVETFTKVALSNVGKDLSKEGTDENDEGGGGKKNNKKDR